MKNYTRLELEIELHRIAAEHPDYRDALETAARIVNNSRLMLEGEQRPTSYEKGYEAGIAEYADRYFKMYDENLELRAARRKARKAQAAKEKAGP